MLEPNRIFFLVHPGWNARCNTQALTIPRLKSVFHLKVHAFLTSRAIKIMRANLAWSVMHQ
jgi:hypothetical protein